MAEEEKPQNGDSRDSLEELGEQIKAKLAIGKLVFNGVVVPKAKEVFEKAKETAEGQFKKVRDSLDPTRGLARNAVEVRDWLVEKGLSLKRANEVVVETVTKTVKETKPQTKKPLDGTRGKEDGKNE